MSIKERRVVVEPTEALENISLGEENLERSTRVKEDLEEKTKKDLVHFLRKNIEVFA